MGNEFVQAVLTAFGALGVGWFLHALQQGGRRRQVRREIAEELELLKLLGGRPGADELGRRIDRQVEEYLLPTIEVPLERRVVIWAVRLVFWGALLLFLLSLDLSNWQTFGIAMVVAVVVSLIEAVWESRWYRRQQEIFTATQPDNPSGGCNV